jgi:hypothetical protein
VGSALYATGAAEGMVSNFGPNGILAKNILPSGKWWLFLYEWTFNICNIIVGIVGASESSFVICQTLYENRGHFQFALQWKLLVNLITVDVIICLM